MLFLLNTVGISEKVSKSGDRYVVEDISDRIFSKTFKVERLFDARRGEIKYYLDSQIYPLGVFHYEDDTFKRIDGVEIVLKDEMLKGLVAYATIESATVRDVVSKFGDDLLSPERDAILGYIAVAVAMGLIWIRGFKLDDQPVCRNP